MIPAFLTRTIAVPLWASLKKLSQSGSLCPARLVGGPTGEAGATNLPTGLGHLAELAVMALIIGLAVFL